MPHASTLQHGEEAAAFASKDDEHTQRHARYHTVRVALHSGLHDPAHWSYDNHLLPPRNWVDYSPCTIASCSAPNQLSEIFRNVAFRVLAEDIAFLLVRHLDRRVAL